MKKIALLLSLVLFVFGIGGCSPNSAEPMVAATTMPVSCFTQRLCRGTPIQVTQLVTESVSCLHDYSLQVSQMRVLEQADLIVISGGGLEDFLEDALTTAHNVCDSSQGISLLCSDRTHEHAHGEHAHSEDPHFWLAPNSARVMAENICNGLSAQFPDYSGTFSDNLTALLAELDALQSYGEETLSGLQCRELVTFHDGFAYFAEAFDLTILEAVEEESGSEASAADLKHLAGLVREHRLPAIFAEVNGSVSAASVISAETGVKTYYLSMAMSGTDYFTEMYQNINTIKEALG